MVFGSSVRRPSGFCCAISTHVPTPTRICFSKTSLRLWKVLQMRTSEVRLESNHIRSVVDELCARSLYYFDSNRQIRRLRRTFKHVNAMFYSILELVFEVKVQVRSYIARYPVRRTTQSALHFTPWQTCSFQGHLNFSGKHSATLQLREDYSFTFLPLSVLPDTHINHAC